MPKLMLGRVALAAALLVLPVAAKAAIVEFDFTGNIVAGPGSAPLNTVVAANNPVSGFFRYDAATVGSGGDWTLPTAKFHVQFDTLTLDTTGATAHVGVNQDLLTFTASVPGADFPFSIVSAFLSLGFQTFIDGFFSLTDLPTDLPPNDHTLGLHVNLPGDTSDGASTDTELFVTARVVPEPATFAILVAGLLALGLKRRQLRQPRRVCSLRAPHQRPSPMRR